VTLSQAAPVQNTWYTVLNTTNYVRIIGIGVGVLVANETVECRLTVDCVVLPVEGKSLTFGNDYAVFLLPYSSTGLTTALCDWYEGCKEKAFLIEGKNVKVEVRKTTAAGAGDLKASVAYQTLE
jgi:hypothetical protein